jgi:predicted transcriptional regulator
MPQEEEEEMKMKIKGGGEYYIYKEIGKVQTSEKKSLQYVCIGELCK